MDQLFKTDISTLLSKDRIYTDYLRRLAWGTDAGFYRMIPEMVLFPKTVSEVSEILRKATETKTAITFRAAGTSLSGQSISDSILLVAGKNWEKYSIGKEGETISMEPGIIGERVNQLLKPFGRKFSPDPASVKSAMIGGIIINNASGMNCGTHANSDKVILSVKIVFADGSFLDTGNEISRRQFLKNHPKFIADLESIRQEVCADPDLVARIRKKYAIKNVTGLNIFPLVRFEDPFDLITHLMVGSEGTLAFLAEATVKTEIDLTCKASAMIYFDRIKTACQAVQILKKSPVASAELLDRKALRSVENEPGMPSYLKNLPEETTAVLVEAKGASSEDLHRNIKEILGALGDFSTYDPEKNAAGKGSESVFTEDPAVYNVWWSIRSGIFPSVGGMREPGTTTLIEDVAFPIDVLPEATDELQKLIDHYGYKDGVIYGHALEGNFHFILNQRFDSPKEVARYEGLMRDVVNLVVDKYDGSLKAEHGTGRNMAPFVEKEWGSKAFEIMKKIKKLFDPDGIINPGVIFNDDPNCFIKNFKPLPLCEESVDKCIECGFCEVNCLTCGFTLSSRQRIVIQREMARLRKSGENPKLLKELKKGYYYLGNMTCAGDGLCSTSCPMGINTGHLTHLVREWDSPKGSVPWILGKLAGDHLQGIKMGLRPVLMVADMAHAILGSGIMSGITDLLHKGGIPLWRPSMPKAHSIHVKKLQQKSFPDKVVYFPSCINQAMGTARNAPDQTPLSTKMVQLLQKAGYEAIFPKGMDNLCCGTIWESKGMPDIADKKTKELEEALWQASEKGKYPVLCDQSPCLYRMRHEIKKMKLYEPVEFIEEFLVDRLDFHPIEEPIAVHTTCSMTKMKLQPKLIQLAGRCSAHVLVPQEVGCCGFAGDKGFTYPEVNRYALRKLRPQLEAEGIKCGYSNSRTCEIGLSTNGGIPYVSIVYLVDQCTTPKK
ncbi:MAG: FAD-binding and (Fe-S)-binding domain-containing protein [Planctomycetia bacterium]|nr:FAD-binding and (Fe-S)-binding domain-containing protein [Planctomycetia bacterium]